MRCDDRDAQTKSADEFVRENMSNAALRSNERNAIETDLMKKHFTEETLTLQLLTVSVFTERPERMNAQTDGICSCVPD